MKQKKNNNWRLIHDMYEASVQNVESEVEFIEEMFQLCEFDKPQKLREDFCGTAQMSAQWIKKDESHTATGIDLDNKTLKLAKELCSERLTDAERERLTFNRTDVRQAPNGPFDVVVGFNFSYCVFHERKGLLEWMKNAYESLNTPGALMLDVTGGSELTMTGTDEREVGDFKYFWEQCTYNPITARSIRYIHFEDENKRYERAFTYDWRLWRIPELRDALAEAGFSNIEVYWEGATEDGEGDGVFSLETDVEQEEAWIAYIVAWK